MSELEIKKKIRDKRRAQGLCAICGINYSGDKYRCDKCNAIRRNNRKYLYDQRINEGLCTMCGQKLKNDDFRLCNSCSEKLRTRRNKNKSNERLRLTSTDTNTTDLILNAVKKVSKSMGLDSKVTTSLISKLEIELDLIGFGIK